MSFAPDREQGTIGVAFSGQGVTRWSDVYTYADSMAQVNGALFKKTLGSMEDASGLPLSQYLAAKDESVLINTQVLQAFLGAAHLTAIRILNGKIPDLEQIKLTAGHSSGEVPAMAFAEVYEIDQAVEFISHRGLVMHGEAEKRPSGLFIPLGLERKATEDVVEATKEKIPDDEIAGLALVNDKKVNVVGVTEQSRPLAESIAKEMKAGRIYPVNSEGAWHTMVMAGAVEPFWTKVVNMVTRPPLFPIALNDETVSSDPEAILASHIDRFTHTSEWLTAVKRFVSVDKVILVGPNGKIPGFNEDNGFKADQLVSFFDFVK